MPAQFAPSIAMPSSVLTTFTSYGFVPGDRQADIFRKFTTSNASDEVDAPTYRIVMRALQDPGIAPASS